MKTINFLIMLSCCMLHHLTVIGQQSGKSNNHLTVYDGRTPCQDFANQLNEKVTEECIKIKWRLFLYKDDLAGTSGHYELSGFIYKRDKPRTGNWHTIRGTITDPDAIVYQLDLQGQDPLYLLKADDNVLFFLDKNKEIMVGNRDFSYTLNKVDRKF